MTQPNLVELAKKGDPQAIAALMNRSLQPKGMTASADRQGNLLEVVLEAEQVPNRQALTTFVEKGLSNLGVKSISSVKILGKQTGAVAPAWVQELNMGLSTSPAPVNATPVPTAPPRVAPPPRLERVVPPPPPHLTSPTVPLPPGVSNNSVDPLPRVATSLNELRDGQHSSLRTDDDVIISGPSDSLETPSGDGRLGQPSSTVSLDQTDSLLGSQALDHTNQGLYTDSDNEDDFLDIDPNDAALAGTYALDHPDEPIEESDDLYDIDPNDIDQSDISSAESVAATPLILGNDRAVEDPIIVDYSDRTNELFGDDAYVAADREITSDDFLEQDLDDEPILLEPDNNGHDSYAVNHAEVAQDEEPLPVAYNLDYHESRLEEEHPVREDIELASLEGPEAQQEDEPSRSALPWSTVIIALVGIWIALLLGYIVWLRSPSEPDPTAPASQPSPAGTTASPSASTAPPSPPPTETTVSPAAPASPSPAVVPVSPAASPSPATPASPVASPSLAASPNAAVSDVLPPPAIACQPVQARPNAQPVEFSNLEFEANVPGADGDYVVGCLTNNTSQPIATVSFAFQGNSTQNSAIVQLGSTQLTLPNGTIQPQQTIPFRSVYTVNPQVNNLTIRSVSWIPAGAIQAQQSQASVRLTR